MDQASGQTSPASPRDLDVEEFATTPDGRRLALFVRVTDAEQADRFARTRGVVITEDDFLLEVDARGAAKTKPSRTAVVAADNGGGAITVFGGKRSLALMRPAISADGRYLTFHALGEACLTHPPGKRTRRSANGRARVRDPAERTAAGGVAGRHSLHAGNRAKRGRGRASTGSRRRLHQ